MTEFQPKYVDLTPDKITEVFRSDIYAALHKRYGAKPDALIMKRVEDEWEALTRSDTVLDAAALYELTLWLRENRIPYWLDAGTGSSFLFYLLGLSSGNPLPPHYYCPKCHRVDWDSYIFRDGFDLPDLSCEFDGSARIRDGHDIPYQMLWGYGQFEGFISVLSHRCSTRSFRYWASTGCANGALNRLRRNTFRLLLTTQASP